MKDIGKRGRRDGGRAHPFRCPVWNVRIVYFVGKGERFNTRLEQSGARLERLITLKTQQLILEKTGWSGSGESGGREHEPTRTDTWFDWFITVNIKTQRPI